MSNWTIEELLRAMHEKGASDLLLTVGTPPQLRINGLLEPYGTDPLHKEDTESLARNLIDESQLAILRTNRSIDFAKGYEGLARFRVNIFFQRDSMALAIRLIPFGIKNFDELGLPPIVEEFANLPHGLLLVTGPAGSGKSTTLAAMIDYINRHRPVHIVCIEDPIEYTHQHRRSTVDQRDIGADCHSFAEALKTVFRQSPDVIMVGEIRDLETMQLALTLAETGHLILGTLHTQDTTHAINRIIDSFPASQQQQIYTQLSLVLLGVISQQLLLSKDGSRRCLAYEVLKVTNAVRNLIRERQLQQIYSVLQTGRTDGMITMNECLCRLCQQNLIEPDVALSRSTRPTELMMLLKRNRVKVD